MVKEFSYLYQIYMNDLLTNGQREKPNNVIDVLFSSGIYIQIYIIPNHLNFRKCLTGKTLFPRNNEFKHTFHTISF